MNARPLFSVILPTRNRSGLFAVALQSILDQRFRDFEILVIDDGSLEEDRSRCRALLATATVAARFLPLPPSAHGHGPSFTRNFGVADARGDYLCFLDDDDQWTDPDHLGRVAEVIVANDAPVDLILANQRAFRDGAPVAGTFWIEDLKDRLPGTADRAGAYSVDPAELLACPAHCHLNTTIVSRQFYLDLGELDERLRYEEDRDFYLRAIDGARLIKYLPVTVSRHNIGDPATKSNLSTCESELARRLDQLRVLDKAVLSSQRPELRRYAMRHQAWTLKHIATEAARNGQFDAAAWYAREALMARPTLGWLALTLLFTLRRLLPRRKTSEKDGHLQPKTTDLGPRPA